MNLKAIIPIAAIAIIAASPSPAADVEIIDVFGAGGQATLKSTSWIDIDLCIDTEVHVQVSLAGQHTPPGKPSNSPRLGIAVVQTICDSGETLFEGQGVMTDLDFQVGANLDWATLQGKLEVLGSTSETTRTVELDLLWAPTGAPEPLNLDEHTQQAPGSVVNVHHEGTLRQVTALGEILVSDPSSDADPIAVTGPSLSAALWDTSSRRITVMPAKPDASAAFASIEATSCTGGTWSGYWTWVPLPSPPHWVWTWVFYPCSGGWIVS